MFKLADPKQAWPHTVSVPVPTKEGFKTHTFTAQFVALPMDKLQALLDKKDDVLFLKTVVKDFDAIQDHDGKPLKCTAQTLESLSQIGYFTHAVVDAYLSFVRGIGEKN